MRTKLPAKVEIPRSVNLDLRKLEVIDICIFGDASFIEAGAIVYAGVKQSPGTNQVMLTSNSRLSKKRLTELVVAQVLANLSWNTKLATPNQKN